MVFSVCQRLVRANLDSCAMLKQTGGTTSLLTVQARFSREKCEACISPYDAEFGSLHNHELKFLAFIGHESS